ncbi:hypothetical protein, partial [Alcaligenes nematophilus]
KRVPGAFFCGLTAGVKTAFKRFFLVETGSDLAPHKACKQARSVRLVKTLLDVFLGKTYY